MGISEQIKIRARAHGRVQGVGFRRFVYKLAQSFPVGGWVRNNPDGTVEIEVAGQPAPVAQFLEQVKKGSFLARVDELEELGRDRTETVSGQFVIKN